MSDELQGRRVAFLVANDGVEQVELTEPWAAVEDAGGEPDAGRAGGWHGAGPQPPGRRLTNSTWTSTLADAAADEFDALVLPGGVANPDELRTRPDAVAFVRSFVEAGKPIAAICHAPWTLVEAEVVRGRRLTSWPSLRTDITNAGGEWVDEEVVVSSDGPGTIVTSRKPDDLKAFCYQLIEVVAGR